MANRFTLKWNTPANCWMIDIMDDAGNPVITGISMVTGADLLAPYGYLKSQIAGQLLAQTDHDTDAVPTFDNLGKDGHLYYASP